MESKTHWREFHPTDYLGSHNFEENERKVLTIGMALREKVNDGKGRTEECLVVRWKDRDVKPMIINVTNAKAISKVAGSDFIEDWAGVTVELYTTMVNAFGEDIEAVRIMQTAPKVSKPELTPDHPKWNGAVESLRAGQTDIAAIRRHYRLSRDDAQSLENEAKMEAA